MKRSSVLVALVLLCAGLSYLASCSSPLEINNSSPDPGPGRIDTFYIFDTLTPSDTAVRIDTIRITDTVTVTDSTITVDTLIRFDTISVTDTQTVVDTMMQWDTVTTLDTVTLVDTTTLWDTVSTLDTVTLLDTMTLWDTVTTLDTVTLLDTMTLWDTLTTLDTVTLTDTVTRVDSVNCGPRPQLICGRISSNVQDIFWMFRNAAGAYHLEFSGSTERDKPLQTLLVSIDGTTFEWKAGTNPLLVKDLTLSANAVISISLENPGAYGHDIDVCLTMTPQ